MKSKLFAVLTAFFVICLFAYKAEAQFMTEDLIFIKGGYIPSYTVTYEEKENLNDDELTGGAVQAEYNLNFNGFWLGFGLEYQRITDDGDQSGTKDLHHNFILPMVSIKVAAAGGLYVGGGVSGKYLISTDDLAENVKFKKEIDLWGNGILGYHFPVGEGVFLNLEGRFGWNITNNQFSKIETSSETIERKTKSAYDIAFYAGVGFRALGSYY